MSDKNKLSICTVVHNDEARILDYLNMVKGRAEEIILVDIGSTDKTAELIRRTGMTVYAVPWNDSRSEIKNFCMDQASGRWILFLQPYEELQEEHWQQLEVLMENPNAEEYLIYVESGAEKGRIVSPVDSLRLIRNRKEYRYQYRSFEYIPDEIIGNKRDSYLRIKKVSGFSANVFDKERLSLLPKDLEEKPDRAYLFYRRGIALLNENRSEEAAISLEAAKMKAVTDYFYTPHLYKCLAWSYISIDHPMAPDVLEEGIGKYPDYLDILILRGEWHKRRREYQEAVKDYERGLKILHNKNLKPAGTEITKPVILENLGWLHDKLLNRRKAAICYFQVVNMGSQKELLSKLGEVLIKAGDRAGFDLIFHEAAEKADPESMLILMDALYRYHDYDGVLSSLNALEQFLEPGEADLIRYSCFKFLGRSGEANSYFSILHMDPRFRIQFLQQEIEELFYEGCYDKIKEKLAEIEADIMAEDFLKTAYKKANQSLNKELAFDATLNEKENEGILLSREEQEVLEGMLDHFLWQGRILEVKQLLALIFSGKNSVEKEDLVQKLVERAIFYGSAENAKQIAAYTGVLLPEPLTLLLWFREKMAQLEQWLERIPLKDSRSCSFVRVSSGAELHETPEYHYKTGNRFAASGKKREAFFAYLQVIMREPGHEAAQNHITEMLRQEPAVRKADLLSEQWRLCVNQFHEKSEFRDFIIGFTSFFRGDLAGVIETLATYQMSQNPLIDAYLASSYWLSSQQAEASVRRLEKESLSFKNKVFTLCENHFLKRLTDYLTENPDADLIADEIQTTKVKQRLSR